MDKRKIWIVVMFLIVGLIAVFRTVLWCQTEDPLTDSQKPTGQKEPLMPPDLREQCGVLINRLMLIAVTLPFVITAVLLTASAVYYE